MMMLDDNTGPGDDYEAFCRLVFTATRLDLRAYKRGQMERRIRSMAEHAGAPELSLFWQKLRRDPAAMRTFLDRITINVSEFFRNPERFEELRTLVLPELLRAGRPLSVWSAGCSYGAEPYALYILLQQAAPGAAHRVLASDIDDGILVAARQGIYAEADLKQVPPHLRRRYFAASGTGIQVAEACRRGVEFRRHDLLRDPYPPNQDLILCRNVVIYFTDEAKHRVFSHFYGALRPGGCLLVGNTERIADAAAIGFRQLRPFWYQRPA
jgi:chemotaxis protein methyltransferase CheR